MPSGEAHKQRLLGQGIRLEYFTIAWNLIEAAVAVGAGLVAGSIALIGFGLDSLIEVTAAGALPWRLQRERRGGLASADFDHGALEKRALLIVGLTFFALALYILVEAGWQLVSGDGAEASRVGIILAAVSLVVMPALALLKQQVARALDSSSLAAEAMETWICSYLSLVLLLGLGANALWGWPWADSLTALAMLPLIVREGWEALAEAREGEDEDDDER